jgi:hypothetical protein
MPTVELPAILIVAIYVVVRARSQEDVPHFFLCLGSIAAGSWLAEESCIRLYGFYSYHPGWSLFLGHVPILVVLIWPLVIHSAWDLAKQLVTSNSKLVPLLAGTVVFTDAALMEPVATGAGLWSWFEPGVFRVPPVVFFGWAFFAGSSAWCCHRICHQRPTLAACLLMVFLPVITVHGVLLTMWWAVFRWVNSTVDPIYPVILAWIVSVCLVIRILRHKTGKRLEKKALLLRLPGALFFFGLLVLNTEQDFWLITYAFAFAPPYLALMSQQYSGLSLGGST